ncbi:hypothetical protein RFI_03276 [Reticulomyxa filosa]|uniref:Uncharacterized protein n=1 Tax=Reticulomyxa filosa TaxID=46433 RepID=X6P6T5_RETFI|nr:hypothetical protein RFI_03276 [Reticulomyxa filosa]|eukprot:ETO33828.1 hypothetical protein RFI_03276 [Reticulomyxa filosa]
MEAVGRVWQCQKVAMLMTNAVLFIILLLKDIGRVLFALTFAYRCCTQRLWFGVRKRYKVAASLIMKSNNVVVVDNWMDDSKVAKSFGETSNQLFQCVGGAVFAVLILIKQRQKWIALFPIFFSHFPYLKDAVASHESFDYQKPAQSDSMICYWQDCHSRNEAQEGTSISMSTTPQVHSMVQIIEHLIEALALKSRRAKQELILLHYKV